MPSPKNFGRRRLWILCFLPLSKKTVVIIVGASDMKTTDYMAWLAQIDKLTPWQRQQTMEALAKLQAQDQEPVFYIDDSPIELPDPEPDFFH